ncbi:MAG: ArsI/CadI family heavy metal resistance metalloenzyme [Alphaproteobacteria bacterium]
MKRLHVNLAVESIEDSVRFYSTLFGAEPSVRHADYAKWMLDDPRVNFAIAARGRDAGLDHLGIQVESGEELAEVTGRLKSAGEYVLDQKGAGCCYARSDKGWAHDPQGIVWETFHTTGQIENYGEDTSLEALDRRSKASCCAPG